MSFTIKEFEHLKFTLEEIKLATKDFTDCIGQGGFGKVYKGELLISEELTMVAVKRLNNSLGQGAPEFWREIMLLTRYKHDNLVCLLGFCDEGHENILVYEYLPNKSLDLYLSSTDLSWNQRLHICVGAAHGLQYLHEPFEGSQQRVLHRDIKSANILLDQNWKAKIADFGLSKFGPANQQFTFLFSNAVGTMGYCDPLYVQTGYLTKESDIYSFGAVLFEVLCGRQCVQISYEDNRRFLPVLARKCYEEKILDTIVDNSLKEKISPQSLERFSKIAYQCLRIDRTERPLVTEIVKELEIALQYQEEYEFEKENELKRSLVSEFDSDEYWDTKLPRDLDVIIKMFEIPNTICALKRELFSFLHKGILFDEGTKFFWINNDGKKCLSVSSVSFLDISQHKHLDLKYSQHDSRFAVVVEYSFWKFHDVKCQIKTSMLSLGTMYEARLVFKYQEQPNVDLKSLKLITIKWKTQELLVRSTNTIELTSDNWCTLKMWHFINHGLNADFDITIEALVYAENPSISSYGLLIQGIEFHPESFSLLNKLINFAFGLFSCNILKCEFQGKQLFVYVFVNHNHNIFCILTLQIEHEDIEVMKGLTISDEEVDIEVDDEEYWEKKLPDDYRRYIEMSDKSLNYTTKKELYFLLCEGFLSDNGRLWFSLCKLSRGICSMLPATEVLRDDSDYERLETLSLSESRFGEAIKLIDAYWFRFNCKLQSTMFSPHHTYACYLVFKFEDSHILPDDHLFGGEYDLDGIHAGSVSSSVWDRVFFPTNIPTINPKYGLPDSTNIRITEVDGSMEQRDDGWKKVVLCKPRRLQDRKSLSLKLTRSSFSGIIVAGIEFRPCI